MGQTVTIADLVAADATGSRLVAGAAGLRRDVLWAHTCEMPHPHRWLGPDELLMTIGIAVPADVDGQVEFIRDIDGSGLAGVMIADGQQSPDLLPEMLAEADRLGVPVIVTEESVPFASIARLVAAANSSRQTQQILTLAQLYRASVERYSDYRGLIAEFESIFDVAMSIVDVRTGTPVLPGRLELAYDEIVEVTGDSPDTLPSRITRIGSLRDGAVSAWQIAADRRTVLFVDEDAGALMESFTLAHLSQVLASEANRRASAGFLLADRRRRMLDDLVGEDTGLRRAAPTGETADWVGERCVATATSADSSDVLFETLTLMGIDHASITRGDYFVSVIPADVVERLEGVYRRWGGAVGVSPEFGSPKQAFDAILKAQWVVESIGVDSDGVVHYAQAPFSVFVHSDGQSNEVIDRVLGSLLDGDSHRAPLVETLWVYLNEDRSWSEAAKVLDIHRQTLGYRLGKIEKLTGRSLKSTKDLAELWAACVALKSRAQHE